MKNSILTEYTCTVPFEDINVMQGKDQYFCCKDWLDVDLSEEQGFNNAWNSNISKKIRESVLDGSFKYCNHTVCPHLNTVIKHGRPSGPVRLKSNIDKSILSAKGPSNIKFTFDSACNLACPSCRVDFIRNSPAIEKRTDEILEDIYQSYGKYIKTIMLSGYGDPFYSTSFFKFLCNLDAQRMPMLEQIHLHTNAILWNERNWEKIAKAHPYIKSAEISIDAATKETYEIVRRGGNWELLMKNLQFINSIEDIQSLIFSFVLQKQNYKEIVDFYYLIKNTLPNKKVFFQYYSVQDWGVMDKQSYIDMKVWDKQHPEHEMFNKVVSELMLIKDKNISISY